jgi:uncharacterized membrane protein
MNEFGFNRQGPAIPNSSSGESSGQELSESVLQVVALPWQQEAPNLISEKLAQRTSAVEKSNDCEVEGERNVTQISSDRKLEQFVSQLLKYGVLLASTVVFVGGVLYLLRHGAEAAEYQFFHGEPPEFCSPWGVVQAALSGDPRGIIQLGILLLIATPVARVAFSLLVFLWQRDLIYVFVTSFVLAGLIYSLIGAYL